MAEPIDPQMVVEALERLVTGDDEAMRPCDHWGFEQARTALPHAQAIAEMWPSLRPASDYAAFNGLVDYEAFQELVAAARASLAVMTNGTERNTRLRAALKPFEEAKG